MSSPARFGVKKLALCGMFICFAGALSALETLLPPIAPIPGVRVGLGNIVTLFLLYIGGSWKPSDALIVSVLRCFLAALLTGSLMNAAYGITGGLLALGAMLVTKRLLPKEAREKYLPFTGIAGAVFHIIGQLLTAAVFYGTLSVLAYLPILISSAVIGGAFTGLCTMLMLKKMSAKFLEGVRKL